MDGITLALVISIPIIVIAVTAGVILGLKVRKSGLVVKRSGSFYKETSVFYAAASAAVIRKALGQFGLNSHRIEYGENPANGSLHFSCPGWTAQLVQTGPSEFAFDFTHFETHNGVPANLMQMNVLLTALEKAFLSVDPEASVVRWAKAMKTKTSIW